jgi:hypothetical protein
MKQVLFVLLVFISFNGFSQSIQFDNLEVMEKDLGKMNWGEAKKACEKLGDGWRLPTIRELQFMYYKRDKIGAFKDWSYWSSTEFNSNLAWHLDFTSGNVYFNGYSMSATYYVRAVRDIN